MLNWIFLLLALNTAPNAAERYLEWSPETKLTWADFEGYPDPSSEMLAFTHTKITYSWNCFMDRIEYRVVAKFDRAKSWKKETVTDQLLAHEQAHFDLAELYARKTRKLFADMQYPCDLEEAEIKEKVAGVHKDWQNRQVQYDKETNHNKDKVAQARWLKTIKAELAALADFNH